MRENVAGTKDTTKAASQNFGKRCQLRENINTIRIIVLRYINMVSMWHLHFP